jgi:hypothetical protein
MNRRQEERNQALVCLDCRSANRGTKQEQRPLADYAQQGQRKPKVNPEKNKRIAVKLKIFMLLCLGAICISQKSHAQWVVSDPGNLAQGIINATKNIVQTSTTAQNMVKSFQETVKIYNQGV